MLDPKVRESQKRIIHSFQTSAPVDAVGLAGALGLKVWESDRLGGASGKLFRDAMNGGWSGYSIVVNSKDPLVRKRFTIAHEIAHFILHADQAGVAGITDDEFYRSGLGSMREAEANRLAAEILMPSRLLQRGEVPATARDLEVSEMALSIRKSYLGQEQFL
jgi:hypothetical protein